jgi:hypothetical protein
MCTVEVGSMGRVSTNGLQYVKHGIQLTIAIDLSDNSIDILYSTIIDTSVTGGSTPPTVTLKSIPGDREAHLLHSILPTTTSTTTTTTTNNITIPLECI